MKLDAKVLVGDLLEYRSQNRWLVLLIVLCMGSVGARFFQLQVLGGKKYEKLAEIDQVKRTRIPARRGQVLDRKGRVVATNVDLYRVSVVPHYVEDIDGLLSALQPLLKLTDETMASVKAKYEEYLPDKKKRFREILVKRFVNGRFCPDDGTLLEEVEPVQHHWCRKCGQEHIRLPESQKTCPYDHSALELSSDGKRGTCPACARHYVYSDVCPDDGTPFDRITYNLRCPRCQHDHFDSAAYLLARLHEMPGLVLSDQIVRAYPFGELFAHSLGYVSEVTADDLASHPGVYIPGEQAGRRGVEKYMEEVLRGKSGEEVTFRDSRGRNLSLPGDERTLANLKYEPAVPGNNIVLTMDVEIQQILKEAVGKIRSAGIVVLDAGTGEVLGMYSTPSFDPNLWSGRLTAAVKKEYDENPYAPMLNKATSAFPPGSTFKPVTALAALNEGVITPQTRVNCPGHYDYAGHRFGCYNQYGHGDMDLMSAVIMSCDVFFYRLGEWLGMDRIEHYASLLGLGRRTGVEMGEDSGTVPSREWHEKHTKGGFQPGFTISTAVGQKDIRATPLQMALVFAELFNGGRLLHPFTCDRVEDGDGNEVRTLRRSPSGEIGVPPEYLELLRTALTRAVDEETGTGHKARLESIRMGGKTGTAEARQVKRGVEPIVARWLAEDHAWYVGFAPAAKPTVAVACIVEHGGFGGDVAAPIVSRVIYKLFSRGLVRLEDGETTIESLAPGLVSPVKTGTGDPQ